MAISDTTPPFRDAQRRVQTSMSGEQRLLVAYEMSLFARGLAADCIRREHPDWPEAGIARELLRLAFLPEPLPLALR
jgi:hypothetical protein